jgi:hypothetical protein
MFDVGRVWHSAGGSAGRHGQEQAILDQVGSYGKQPGHIGDALQVLLRHLDGRG